MHQRRQLGSAITEQSKREIAHVTFHVTVMFRGRLRRKPPGWNIPFSEYCSQLSFPQGFLRFPSGNLKRRIHFVATHFSFVVAPTLKTLW